MLKLFDYIKTNQLAKFVVCAFIYNVIGISIYWIFLLFDMSYLYANAISALIAILIAYLLNTKYVFNQKYTWDNFVKFTSVYISNLIISSMGMIILIEIINVNEYVANPLMIILNVIYNFTLTKFWAMRKKD